MKRTLIIFLAGVLGAAPAAADPLTATVIVTRADLASPPARARLDRRIRAAIENVCGSYATIEASQWQEMDACWTAARAEVSKHLANVRSETQSDLASK